MKKFLLVFLLLVLPLQYAWSAAAAYCSHENTQRSHFGHHSHEHHAQASDDQEQGESEDKSKIAKWHNDCGTCHFSVQVPLTPTVPALAPLFPETHSPSPIRGYTSHIPERPAMPDWFLVA